MSILRIVIVLIIGIILYNYFLGSKEEKASSEKVINEFVELGKSVGELIANEKERFDQGKYDKALNQIGSFIEDLKSKAGASSKEVQDQIRSLEKHKKDIQSSLSELTPNAESPDMDSLLKQNKQVEKDIQKLMKEAERVLQKLSN